MTIEELSLEVEETLGRVREDAPSLEDKERLLVAIEALRFISSTGQSYDFEDYRNDLESHAPPRVFAAFDGHAEADAWLKTQVKPPHLAYVLIADEYHIVLYLRETNHRALSPHPVLAYHLDELMREGLPPAAATFNTREEALAWFNNQQDPQTQTVIRIGSEHHLAINHRNVNRRTIHPFSLVRQLNREEGRDPSPQS